MSLNSTFKKVLTLVLALSMVLCLFAGCSSEQAGEEETTEKTEKVSVDESYVKNLKKSKKLVVGVKTDVPGLSYQDPETGEWSGLEVELAYNVGCALFGVNRDEVTDMVELVGVTVADREEKLENGDIDLMLATYTITDERAEKFALSDSYYTDYIGIMVRYTATDANSLGSDNINSLADLDGKVIGVPKNATTRADMLNYIETANTLKVSPRFAEYSSYEQLFKALKNGDIDAMSVDVSILNGYVDSTTKILGDRFAGQHYGAAVLPEHAGLLDIVNTVING